MPIEKKLTSGVGSGRVMNPNRGSTLRGQDAAQWAGQIDPSPCSAEHDQAQEARAAIRALCANNFPALVRALDYDFAPRQIKLRTNLRWLPRPVFDRLMDTVLYDRKARLADTAERAFWALGSDAAPAIPALTRLRYSTNPLFCGN